MACGFTTDVVVGIFNAGGVTKKIYLVNNSYGAISGIWGAIRSPSSGTIWQVTQGEAESGVFNWLTGDAQIDTSYYSSVTDNYITARRSDCKTLHLSIGSYGVAGSNIGNGYIVFYRASVDSFSYDFGGGASNINVIKNGAQGVEWSFDNNSGVYGYLNIYVAWEDNSWPHSSSSSISSVSSSSVSSSSVSSSSRSSQSSRSSVSSSSLSSRSSWSSLSSVSSQSSSTAIQNSSSSSSSSLLRPYETIYAVGDEEATPIIEVTSRVEYDPLFLNPTNSFISDIISGDIAIPLPTTDSMVFDTTRGNLWWLSKKEERIVFATNVRDMVMRSLDLSGILLGVVSITLNQETGEVIVGGFRSGNRGGIVVVNPTCTGYSFHSFDQTTCVNSIVLVDRDDDSVTPFMLNGIENPAPVSDIGESSNTSSSSSIGAGAVLSIDNTLAAKQISEQIAEQAESNASVDEQVSVSSVDSNNTSSSSSAVNAAVIPSTPSHIVGVRVWSDNTDGVASVRAWSLKDKKYSFDTVKPASASMLPMFSWVGSAFSGNPAIIVATATGNLIKMEYSLSAKTLTAICGCTLPTGGELIGLSAINGDGNTYISGNGVLARINLNPTEEGGPYVAPIVPGESSGSSVSSISSASSSSSSKSETSSSQSISANQQEEITEVLTWLEVPVSETTGKTGMVGMSTQYHEKGGKIFLVSRQTGMLMVADSIAAWSQRLEYGPFQEPFKAIWSKHHNGVIVACKRGLNIVSLPSGDKRLIQGLVSNEITDVDERDGIVAILSKSDDGSGGLIKVLSDDLSQNKFLLQVTNEYPVRICLLPEGKAIVALEAIVDGFKKTRLAIANLNSEAVSGFTSLFDGDVVSLFYDNNFDITFAIFSTGKIVVAEVSGSTLLASVAGNIPDGVIVAKGGLVSGILEGIFKQTQVRVFVGSRSGTSDRWDSGVVTTSKTELLYSGNGLEPGERYWLTIVVNDENSGWSAPFSKEFVVPI